jgi:hypothetical protein
METHTLFFEDLAVALDYWKKTAAIALTGESADLCWTDNPDVFRRIAGAMSGGRITANEVESAFEEILRGFATSFLSILDGGTRLAEEVTLSVIDNEGAELTALREGFVAHLFDTKRLQ